jgi:hypothetical protein
MEAAATGVEDWVRTFHMMRGLKRMGPKYAMK